MTVALLALQHALTQVGVKEATGRNDGAAIEEYTFGQHVAWCAFFVAWCFRKAGFPLPGNRWLLGSVAYMEARLAERGWLYDPSTDPLPGDIVFFATRMESDPSRSGRHVGIAEKLHLRTLHTVEGNTSNRVYLRTYDLPHPSITGYGRIP